MNQIQVTRNINARKYIDIVDATHRNHIRFNVHNSKEHEMAKAEICYLLLKHNKEFLTECHLNNFENVADIFVLDSATIIEILHTETEKAFNDKLNKYPEEIKVIHVNSNWSKEELYEVI